MPKILNLDSEIFSVCSHIIEHLTFGNYYFRNWYESCGILSKLLIIKTLSLMWHTRLLTKVTYEPHCLHILRCIALSKIILNLSFTIFWFVQLWKISPQGQGEVLQGSRKSAHFSLTWRAYFSELNKAKKLWKKNPKLFLKLLYILKYSYALVVKS